MKLHHPTMSMLWEHGGQLERDIDIDRERERRREIDIDIEVVVILGKIGGSKGQFLLNISGYLLDIFDIETLFKHGVENLLCIFHIFCVFLRIY